MSTVETIHLHQTVAFLACGHSSMGYEQVVGDEVDCPVCADKAKDVKAARVGALEEVRQLANGFAAFALETRIDKLIEATK